TLSAAVAVWRGNHHPRRENRTCNSSTRHAAGVFRRRRHFSGQAGARVCEEFGGGFGPGLGTLMGTIVGARIRIQQCADGFISPRSSTEHERYAADRAVAILTRGGF